MLASEIIKEFQKRIELYGDWEVLFRAFDADEDIDVMSVYTDEEAERIIVSDFPDYFKDGD